MYYCSLQYPDNVMTLIGVAYNALPSSCFTSYAEAHALLRSCHNYLHHWIIHNVTSVETETWMQRQSALKDDQMWLELLKWPRVCCSNRVNFPFRSGWVSRTWAITTLAHEKQLATWAITEVYSTLAEAVTHQFTLANLFERRVWLLLLWSRRRRIHSERRQTKIEG